MSLVGHGGANAKTSLEQGVFTKYYNPDTCDGRKRFHRESRYIDFLESQDISCFAPKRLYQRQFHSMAFEYLVDAKPVSPEEFADKIAFFLSKIFLKSQAVDLTRSIPQAKEAMLSPGDLQRHIRGRLVSLVGTRHLDSEKADLLNDALKRKLFSFHCPYVVASPSDIGPHNCLKVDERLYFFDFEYAGRDSITKLLMDMALHPSIGLAFEDDEKFLGFMKNFLSQFPLITAEDLLCLREPFSLLWILRILKQLDRLSGSENSEAEEQVKVRRYALLSFERYFFECNKMN